MHEVIFDETLESKLKKMTCEESESSGPDYVVFNYAEVILALAFSTNKEKDIPKSPPFHPLQTKIACGTRVTKCEDELSDICLMGPKNSPLKQSEIKNGSPGTGCSGGDGSSGLCMGGGGGAVKNQSDKKSGDGDVEEKGSKDSEGAVSSASTPMTLLSLVIALIMA
ncbi:hypothetical protein GCK72_003204 [Caenorhabditis remanei]|uniref:Uncharacterized protein n=1 Tax=Caenorhabditis remanei TaxID=31234 RepID=A0A6A5HTV4_CAERE|nr:hypothetical protein GCK72_003204 [Caenorhabditis remanei]KAF1771378.1 hypothetical protein GCK72_003204 [Caenorhabditis remanei]